MSFPHFFMLSSRRPKASEGHLWASLLALFPGRQIAHTDRSTSASHNSPCVSGRRTPFLPVLLGPVSSLWRVFTHAGHRVAFAGMTGQVSNNPQFIGGPQTLFAGTNPSRRGKAVAPRTRTVLSPYSIFLSLT